MYDLTPYINFGGRNVVAVRVDHSDYADSRWYTGSGIYRDVHLVYAEPTHIDLWGVSYSSDIETLNRADVTFRCTVNNTKTSDENLSASYTLTDRENRVVASSKSKGRCAAESKVELVSRVKIPNPHLWNLDDPYLYKLTTKLYCGSKLIDKSEVNVGLRKLTFDANEGFALNDKAMKIKGVCLHHDAGCLGAAVPKEVWVRRVEQLKSIGCNAIRLSHNPQATDLYDICDSLGVMVKDEAFDEWEYPKKKWIKGWNKGTPGFQGSSHYFREWCKRDIADMVKRDRNHPSIIMWSIGNEVDYPNDPYSHPILDQSEGTTQIHVAGYRKSQPNAMRLGEIAEELATEIRKIDTSRPVTGAMAGAVMSNETGYPDAIDVVGYNYTEHRYQMDHQKYPNRILYGSETRHDLAAWRSVADNDFIMGQFIWTGYDYLGESGAWPSRGFTTGMIDLAGNIKPNGLFRRALWLKSPTVAIGCYAANPNHKRAYSAYKHWNFEQGTLVRVVAMTNCQEVELLLNGVVVGERIPYNEQTAISYWDIPYKAGRLEIRGYNDNSVVACDQVETTSAPYQIVASLDKESISKERGVAHLFIEIHDSEGRLVHLADNEITCHINGKARLLGLESGSNDVSDNFRDNKQRAIRGRLLGYIQSEMIADEVTIKLTSPMLKSCTTTLNIK